jgi:hypothetical protein
MTPSKEAMKLAKTLKSKVCRSGVTTDEKKLATLIDTARLEATKVMHLKCLKEARADAEKQIDDAEYRGADSVVNVLRALDPQQVINESMEK